MKNKVLAIVILLCCLHTIHVFGESTDNYKEISRTEDKTEIEVFGDCKNIVIADIAPNGIKVYGDKDDNVTYGGEGDNRFNDNQVKPNKAIKGIKIDRVNGRVVLSVKFDDLSDESEIKIYSAVHKGSKGYCPDKEFKIVVKKNNVKDADLKEIVKKLEKDVDQLKENMEGPDKESHGILPLFIALLVGLLFGYLLFKQNRKVLEKLSDEFSDLKKIVDNGKKEDDVHGDSHHTESQEDKMKNSMTDEDIKRFIVEQIKSLQTQFSPSTLQTTISDNSNMVTVINPVKKEEQFIDTDNVKFHLEDNSFTLEQSDQKIFRIYSKGGEFYYTIINDSAVREEFSCMIQIFGGFLNYLSTGGEAKRIEVVSDGKLRKDGNKFYVDTNNKLVVKFV